MDEPSANFAEVICCAAKYTIVRVSLYTASTHVVDLPILLFQS